MRVIVTRPADEAQRWALELSAQGCDAVALPLIQVGPAQNPSDVLQAWQRLHEYVGVMFVSGNAAKHFFALKQPLSVGTIDALAIKTRAWATGPGTARALLHAGVAPARLDTPAPDTVQFDSEALWCVVATQVRAGDRVLIVRGADSQAQGLVGQGSGRDWFAQRVTQAGAQVDFVVAYQRGAPTFSADQRALAQQAASDGSVWLLSSSEALAHLCAELPSQSWAGARAIATHPRIAAAAQRAGFGVVCQSRPTLSDVRASIESMR